MNHDGKENSLQKVGPSVTISNCVTNAEVIKYFVSIFFSLIIIIFSIFMITSSQNPSSETLWVSILTSTFSIFIPQPQIKQNPAL